MPFHRTAKDGYMMMFLLVKSPLADDNSGSQFRDRMYGPSYPALPSENSYIWWSLPETEQ